MLEASHITVFYCGSASIVAINWHNDEQAQLMQIYGTAILVHDSKSNVTDA